MYSFSAHKGDATTTSHDRAVAHAEAEPLYLRSLMIRE
jgi:hypothetical protein